MVFSTIPPHQLRLSYKFTIVFIEEKRLVSLLLLTVVSNTDLPTWCRILCDLCGQLFHFRCREYETYDTSLSTLNEWFCRLCTPPAAKKPKMSM